MTAKTPAQLKAEAATSFPDNTTGFITPAIMRTFQGDIIDSYSSGQTLSVSEYGAIGNGIADDTSSIQTALDAATDGKSVFFPSGTYNISNTLTITKSIRLMGEMSSLNRGTIIRRIADVKMLTWIGASNAFLEIGGIDHIEFGADKTTYTTDVVELRYCGTGTFNSFVINQVTTGKGLYLGKGNYDHAFVRLFIRGCGSNTNGMLHMEAPDPVDGTLNVNSNRFLGCHFEDNGGNLGTQVYIDYSSGLGRNQNNSFIACKFECSPSSTNPLVKIVSDVSNKWIGCQFNQYSLAFDVAQSDQLVIQGCSAFNDADPNTGFGNFANVDGCLGEVTGQHAGLASFTGNSQRIQFKVISDGDLQDTPSASFGSTVADVGLAGASHGKDYLRYFAGTTLNKTVIDASTEFTGSAIKGNSADFSGQFLLVPSHHSRHQNGLTFNFRAKSSASLQYDVRAKGTALDTIVLQPTIGTGYGWFRASFTPDQCANETFNILINNEGGMGTDFITISEWYLEEDTYYDSAAPISGTWELGARVINSAPTSAGNIGWVCTVAGTPGTWKAFGTIA